MVTKTIHHITIILLFVLPIITFAQVDSLQEISITKIILKGDNGGYANGKTWNSDSLKGKINLILYTDPDQQKLAQLLVSKLDTLTFSKNRLRITFMLNTAATIIPNFIIRTKLKQKAKVSKNIEYVLDQNKKLVTKWNLKDEDLNVIILDKSDKVLYNHFGNITENDIKKIMEILNKSI